MQDVRPYYADDLVTLYHGYCLDVLKALPDCSVDSIVCDPPYGLPGGLVLDPFMGSGSTGKAAMLEGFKFIGIDRELEYCEIAKSRILHVMNSKEKQGELELCRT